MSVVKDCGRVGGFFALYLDDTCEPGTIVIYNYGRAFAHPDDEEVARLEFSDRGLHKEIRNGLQRIYHVPHEAFHNLFG